MNKTKDEGFWRKVKNCFEKVTRFCDHLVFPDDIKCIFCGRDIKDFDEKCYCDECEKRIPFNNKNKCLVCSEPIDNEAVVCDNCQKEKRNFRKAFCPFVYDGIVRNAILSYKDSNQRYKAKPFAKFIANEIQKDEVKIDIISFVPLTHKKEKSRSFNQSKLLAEEIGKILNVEVVDMFIKTRDDKAQKFSSFKERQEKMIGLYALKEGVKFDKSKNVLIVDDIVTTCATVNYCAGLLKNKVANVYVCSIARNKLKQK